MCDPSQWPLCRPENPGFKPKFVYPKPDPKPEPKPPLPGTQVYQVVDSLWVMMMAGNGGSKIPQMAPAKPDFKPASSGPRILDDLKFVDGGAKTNWSNVASGVGAVCVAGVLLAVYFADDVFPAGANDDVYIAPTWARFVGGVQLVWQSF